MQIGKQPLPVNVVDFQDKSTLIRPNQAESTKGMNVIVGEERPKPLGGNKSLLREVLLEKTPEGKEPIKIVVHTSATGGHDHNAKPIVIKPKSPEVGKWKVNEAKKHDKVEKLKPTFKQLLSKYKKDKAVPTHMSRPNGFKRPRSPSRPGVRNHHQPREDCDVSIYPPLGSSSLLPWVPPPIPFPTCPT